MSKIVLVTDSTSGIPADLVKKYNILVAPQILVWSNQTYRDGIDIQSEAFYARLKTDSAMPTTSQATIGEFNKIFTQIVEEGNQALVVTLSNKLSGTLDSALQARDLHPGAQIEIVDSHTIAMALGYIVLQAARAIEQGASLAEAKALVENARANVGVVFAVDTLEFLHRGGRIGGASRFLGTLLNFKPILEVRNGKVEAVERVRTRKKSLQRVVELVEEQIGGRKPVRLATLHAAAQEDAQELLDMATARIETVESIFSEVSPVIGTHAGPGTVGLVYMAGM